MKLTLVVTDDCHFCARARKMLATLGSERPLSVREFELDSAEGRGLAERVPLIFPPILLRDDKVISYGRLSERRLRRELANG